MRRRRGDEWYVERFTSYLVEELGRSERTATSYVGSLRCVSRYCQKPIVKLSAKDLREFLRSDYAPATKQQVVVASHQFFDWGSMEGYWPPRDISAVKTPRIVSIPKAKVSHETARVMLESCRTALEYRVTYLGLYAGLRIAESTQVSEATWTRDRLKILGKGSKYREVPVHPELEKVRHHILEFQPKVVGVTHSALARMRQRLRVTDTQGDPVKSHALRRTFGQTMYDACGKFEIVRVVLGHGKSVTDLYVEVPFDDKMQAVSLVDYYGGQPIQLEMFGD